MKYQKKTCKYDHLYLDADRYFCVNHDDTELKPIYISLPKPPSYYLIDGYGKHPYEQKYTRIETPQRLKLLEKRVYKEAEEWSSNNKANTITGYVLYKMYWDILTKEQEDFQDEIKWIKQIIWYTMYGYWCFIKGKPYYFPPWYFCFLNYWYIQPANMYPEFRYDDLTTELYKWYLRTTKETFKNTDNRGNALKNQYGKYEMIELEHRTFYGPCKTKRRRCGESNRGLNNIMQDGRKVVGGTVNVLADKGENAEKHWEKRLIPAWQRWPFFLKPMWDGNNNPKELFYAPPSNVYNVKGLNTRVAFITSGGERSVDSDQLSAALLDEMGKHERASASSKWGVTKLTLSQGPSIHGYVEMPTTIEEMNQGGEDFYIIWQQSNFYIRDKVTGQTLSGLGREFVPSYRAYDGFIDAWGFSVVDPPTDEQIEYAPPNSMYAIKRIGTRDYHHKRRDALLASGSPRDLKTYRELIRKEPLNSTECWMGTGGDVGFPLEQMQQRLSELRIENYKDIITGNFVEVNGLVEFHESKNGNWDVSMLLDQKGGYRSNERTITKRFYGKEQKYRNVYAPRFKSRFIMGIDPIENLNKQPGGYSQTRLSDCGIGIYWDLDEEHEKRLGNTSTDTYESMCFVATYRNRPNNYHDLVNDVILAARYYGAMMFFERNKTELINRIDDAGYSGYFLHMYNVKTKQFEAMPGGYAQGESINNLFNSLRDHFDLRVHKEKHHALIQEGVDIKGKEQLTRKDLLAACGWALEGAKSTYGKLIDQRNSPQNQGINIYNIFQRRNY